MTGKFGSSSGEGVFVPFRTPPAPIKPALRSHIAHSTLFASRTIFSSL
jgi:hypothetical protein